MVKNSPSLLPDTNIISSLFYNGGNTVLLARKASTRNWWELERKHFRIVGSITIESELSNGHYRGQSDAVAAVKRLPYLAMNSAVHFWARTYIDAGIVPKEKAGDAYQLAFASSYEIDYLLTWNHAHLASKGTAERLLAINKKAGLKTPLLVTPETIPWVSKGEYIRRLR